MGWRSRPRLSAAASRFRLAAVSVVLLLGMGSTGLVSASSDQAQPPGPHTNFGIFVDGVDGITPTTAQVRKLGAAWERSIVGNRGTSSIKRGNDWCRHQAPSLLRVFSPAAKWLMTFNNQSCSYGAPLTARHAFKKWHAWIRHHYLPGLEEFMNANRRALVKKKMGAAIEVWNEEDCTENGSYISPPVYAYMLGAAAAQIQSWNRQHGGRVRTVMGGLCHPWSETAGNDSYLATVLKDGGSRLRGVAAVGLHPSYGTVQPAVWRQEINFFRSVVAKYARVSGPHQIWMTEVGAPGQWGFRQTQASFVRTLFATFRQESV